MDEGAQTDDFQNIQVPQWPDAISVCESGVLFIFKNWPLQRTRTKRATVKFLSKLTAPILTLISTACESRYGWAEVGFLAGCTVVGVLGYERISGTCLELLRAGKVVFWQIQRLNMSHSPVITLSSNKQVLLNTGCATLLALSRKYDFSWEVSVTLWVIKC